MQVLEQVLFEALAQGDAEAIYEIWKTSLTNKEIKDRVADILRQNWRTIQNLVVSGVPENMAELMEMYDFERTGDLLRYAFQTGQFQLSLLLLNKENNSRRAGMFIAQLRLLYDHPLKLEQKQPLIVEEVFAELLYLLLPSLETEGAWQESDEVFLGSAPVSYNGNKIVTETVRDNLFKRIITDLDVDKNRGRPALRSIFAFAAREDECGFNQLYELKPLINSINFIIEEDQKRIPEMMELLFNGRINGETLAGGITPAYWRFLNILLENDYWDWLTDKNIGVTGTAFRLKALVEHVVVPYIKRFEKYELLDLPLSKPFKDAIKQRLDR